MNKNIENYMKFYDYTLSLFLIIRGFIFFLFSIGFLFYIGTYCNEIKCSSQQVIFSEFPFPIKIGIVIGFMFILLGSWRFLVRFQKHNNKIILANDEIIVPGLLQILPEKKVDLRNAEKVEREVVGKNANIVIKILFSDGRKPEKIFWSNFMSVEKFDELYIDLKKLVEKKT